MSIPPQDEGWRIRLTTKATVNYEEAARWLGVMALRDISIDDFVSNIVLKRARHIIIENERVLEAIEIMRLGNVKHLGDLFNASHNSLCDDFEVTNDALNIMIKSTCHQEGSYGSA